MWAMLKLAIQENPVNPADAVFDYLADFIDMEVDKHFAINLGTQEKVKPEDQIQALHIFVDELDVP